MTPDQRGGAAATGGLTERLRQTTQGHSYAHVARVTGCNSETVRRYLNGGTPSVEFIAAVAAQFHVSADWLLLGRGPRRPTAATSQSQAPPEAVAGVFGAGPVQVRSADAHVRTA